MPQSFARLSCWLILAGSLALAACREDVTAPSSEQPEPALAAAAAALLLDRVSAGHHFTCGIDLENRAWCWGINNEAQLGDGTLTNRSRPVLVKTSIRFVQISAGASHACAVSTGNRVYCWGLNDQGQVGPTVFRQRTPRMVATIPFVQVEVGAFHTCALTPTNLAYCWGDNRWGQLGDGTTTRHSSPAPVVGGRKFRRVNAGAATTCAVTPADLAFCWGNNDFGTVGDGTQHNIRPLPVAVADGHAFRQVAVGNAHTCGLTSGRRVFCWGLNDVGQLGDSTRTLRPSPVPVSGDRSFDQLATGVNHSCAVNGTTHRAFCWGENFAGELGDGTKTQRLTPVAVLGGLSFSGVSAGAYHTCGVTTDKLAYCWGHDAQGQLGVGGTPPPSPGGVPFRPKPTAPVG